MPVARIALPLLAAALLLAACSAEDGTEAQVRDAIDEYVAAVNAGSLGESGLSNCSTPFYQRVALQNPGLRPFRVEIDRIETAVGPHRAAGGSVSINQEVEGRRAVVRGTAYLSDRPVRELDPQPRGPYPAAEGWFWDKSDEDGRWRAIECS